VSAPCIQTGTASTAILAALVDSTIYVYYRISVSYSGSGVRVPVQTYALAQASLLSSMLTSTASAAAATFDNTATECSSNCSSSAHLGASSVPQAVAVAALACIASSTELTALPTTVFIAACSTRARRTSTA
jgi:hypothetical protein